MQNSNICTTTNLSYDPSVTTPTSVVTLRDPNIVLAKDPTTGAEVPNALKADASNSNWKLKGLNFLLFQTSPY